MTVKIIRTCFASTQVSYILKVTNKELNKLNQLFFTQYRMLFMDLLVIGKVLSVINRLIF